MFSRSLQNKVWYAIKIGLDLKIDRYMDTSKEKSFVLVLNWFPLSLFKLGAL